MTRRSMVYILGCPGARAIKIGSSVAPTHRIKGLQTACPWPVQLIAEMPGTRRREQAAHEAMAEWHIHGEWFFFDAPGAISDLRAWLGTKNRRTREAQENLDAYLKACHVNRRVRQYGRTKVLPLARFLATKKA